MKILEFNERIEIFFFFFEIPLEHIEKYENDRIQYLRITNKNNENHENIRKTKS